MEPSGQDRRQSKRYAEQIVVQWQRQTSPEAAPSEEWRYAFLRDISKGGLCFETTETLASGDLLYFKVKIHFALWPFTCSGQVLRAKPTGKQGALEIGVMFLHIDPKDADLIDLLAWEQEQKKSQKGNPR